MTKNILQFKITLNDSSPKIWRRIQIPNDYTFWDLHCAIQDAMGWIGYHLHGFTVSKNKAGSYQPIRIQIHNPEWDDGDELDESKELLASWFPKKIKQCIYTYDFGDSWDHTILFEKIIPAEKDKKYPVCLAGKNACPPDDCGGIGGYYDLLTVISNPESERGQELREWMNLEEDEQYDPTVFNCSEIVFEEPKELLREYLENQNSC